MNASHLSSIITSYDLMIDAVFWLRVCVCVCVCADFCSNRWRWGQSAGVASC